MFIPVLKVPQNVSVGGEKTNLETQNPYAVFFLLKVGRKQCLAASFH